MAGVSGQRCDARAAAAEGDATESTKSGSRTVGDLFWGLSGGRVGDIAQWWSLLVRLCDCGWSARLVGSAAFGSLDDLPGDCRVPWCLPHDSSGTAFTQSSGLKHGDGMLARVEPRSL